MENKPWDNFKVWSDRDYVDRKEVNQQGQQGFGVDDVQNNYGTTSRIYCPPGAVGQNAEHYSRETSLTNRIENAGNSQTQSHVINICQDDTNPQNTDMVPCVVPYSPYQIWACGSPDFTFVSTNDVYANQINQNGNIGNSTSGIGPRNPMIGANIFSASPPSHQINTGGYDAQFINQLTKEFGDLSIGTQQSTSNVMPVPNSYNNYGNAITQCLPGGYQHTPPTGSMASSPYNKFLNGVASNHIYTQGVPPTPPMPGVSGPYQQIYGGTNCMTTPQRSNITNFGYMPQQPRCEEELNIDPRAASILNEFRTNRNPQLSLSDITDNVIEFAQDQNGSRFIQQRLERANSRDKQAIFDKVHACAHRLMVDVFGNYVIQKFFEFGTTEQRNMLMDALRGNVIPLALQMYGCRVIQKALEFVKPEQQLEILEEMREKVVQCVIDQNGNHVVQKAIEQVEARHLQFIIDKFVDGNEIVKEGTEKREVKITVRYLSTHPYGCRVIQRVLEFCTAEQKRPVLDQLLNHVRDLAADQYGNYVVQHIIEHGNPEDRDAVVQKISGLVLMFSQHKFASNVIEKCLKSGTADERNSLINEACESGPNEPNGSKLLAMMKDPYANYVVQKMLDVADSVHRRRMMLQIKPHIPSLRKFNYGKHIIMKLERYFQRHNGVPPQEVLIASNERFPIHQGQSEISRNGQVMNR